MAIIHGVLRSPTSEIMPDCTIELRAYRNTLSVIKMTQASVITDANGAYSMDIPAGKYRVSIRPKYGELLYPGDIIVYGNSPSGNLNSFLAEPRGDDLSPNSLIEFQSLANQAKQSADEAKSFIEASSVLIGQEIGKYSNQLSSSNGSSSIGHYNQTVKIALDNLYQGYLNLSANSELQYLKKNNAPAITILYPGGTVENPAVIQKWQRIIVQNPFPNCPVFVQPQVWINGKWGESGHHNEHYSTGAMTGWFVHASQISDSLWGDIIVQSGNYGVAAKAGLSGAPHTIEMSYTSAPYRLLVWRIINVN